MLAESFIKVEPWLDAYRCYVCNQVSLSILRQTCACRKYVCSPCKQRFSYCTYCHQQTAVSQQTQPLPIGFYCPSMSQNCTPAITSVRQLLQHGRKCVYVNEQLRKQMAQIADYQCLKGHQLRMSNTYGKCNVCGDSRHCKSRCFQCNQDNDGNYMGYCIVCRPIRCTRSYCPTGHAISKRIDKRGAYCDICRISVGKVSDVSFSDPDCDFDICSGCYLRLPESLDPLPSTQMIAE